MTNDPNNPTAKQQPDIADGQSDQVNLQALSCEASIQELYGYLDGALEQSRAQGVQAHLASCPGCDEVFSFHNRLQHLVCQMGRAEMPAEVPKRVFGAILGFNPKQEGPLTTNLDEPLSEPNRSPFEI